MLNRNLGSIRDMLVQLSDFFRIEAGQETPEIKEFGVADLLPKSEAAAHPFADNRNLDLRGEGAKKLKVKSDPVKIRRILQNLLMNALISILLKEVYIFPENKKTIHAGYLAFRIPARASYKQPLRPFS